MTFYVHLLVMLIIITPISLFWHELGHALGARFVRASQITLTIGIGKPIFEHNYNNMTFVIRKIFLFHSLTETQCHESLSRKDKLVITFMGPINSLVLSILAYGLFVLTSPHPLFYIMSLFNIWVGLINLLPFKINERQSDGYTILQTIKNKYD